MGLPNLLITPHNSRRCSKIADCLPNNISLPMMVIGNGSNILVLDGGIRGVVLKLGGGLKEVSWRET